MPRALRSYNKFAHVRDYAPVNRIEVPEEEKIEWKSKNGRIEWKNRMEV